MYVLPFQGWLWHDYAHRYRRTTSHLPPYRSTGYSVSSQWKQPHKAERVLAKAQKTQIRGLVCVLFYLLFLFSLSLSLSLLYPPLALFFSLASSSLGSHAGLWREGRSIRGYAHSCCWRHYPPHKDISQIPLRAGETKCTSWRYMLSLLRQWELENQPFAVFALAARNLRTKFYNQLQ